MNKLKLNVRKVGGIMKKIFLLLAVITLGLMGFLLYNHNKTPIKEDIFNITKNWSPATEEVYLVKEIDGEWLTIFKGPHSIMIARLEQNWLGFWKIKDELGKERTLASSYYPAPQDQEFTWSGHSNEDKYSYYFGQILNPNIKKIEVETQKNSFEEALIIHTGEGRFYLAKSNGKLVLPMNISAFSETGELIYSTVK